MKVGHDEHAASTFLCQSETYWKEGERQNPQNWCKTAGARSGLNQYPRLPEEGDFDPAPKPYKR